MREKNEFYKGVVALFSVAGAVISGYLILSVIGWYSLIVFSMKSFLLGSAIGAIAISKKIIVVGEKRGGSRVVKEYGELDDPSGIWFIIGFGSVVAIGTFFLVAGVVALTTLFVFFSGFMFVYSGAAKELVGAREFVSSLSYALILATIFVASIAFFGWAWKPILDFLGLIF